MPAVVQPDDPVAGNGAGDQFEPIGPGDAVEQPGALARNMTTLRPAFRMSAKGWSVAVAIAPPMPT